MSNNAERGVFWAAAFATMVFGAGCAPSTAGVAGASPAAASNCADPPTTQSDQVDPDIAALAAKAKTCAFEDGHFQYDCPAIKEWERDNDDLFEGGAGNATILSMLEDPDPRTRTLAVARGFSSGRAFFADKKRAARLLAVVDKERDPKLVARYGKLVAMIDGRKLFGAELKALAKHPSSDFRSSFAAEALPQYPTDYSVELVKTFLEDPDDSVKRAAIRSLGNSRVRPAEAICTTLRGQLTRNDKLAQDALEAATSSKCPGITEIVMKELEKRTADPAKAGAKDSLDLTSALGSLCWRGSDEDPIKKRAFDVVLKVAPKTEDVWRRRRSLDLFARCDKARAKEALTPYLKDPEKDVVENAKEELKNLEAQH